MNASTSSRLVLQQEDTIHILTVKKSWDGRLKPLILISNVSKMSFFFNISDNYLFQPDGAERIYHNCSGEKYSHDIHSSKLYVKSRILPDTWVPSLLSRRSCFFSCILLTYLAMLQDIRASYLHWVSILFFNFPKCSFIFV